jgi:hypothetical protein
MRKKRKFKKETTLKIRKGRRFFPLQRNIIESSQFFDLSSSEKVLLIYIVSEYNGHNGTAIEPITCPYKIVPLKSTTMRKAIQGLVDKGWIECDSVGGRMKNANKYYFGATLLKFFE